MTTKKTKIFTVKTQPKKLSLAFAVKNETNVHDRDFFKWTTEQACFLRRGEFDKLDIQNLTEEIESLGISQLDALESHLCILLLHLLKARYQPSMHTRSWDLSIRNARYHIAKILKKNPSFKVKLPETLTDAYFSGRLKAIDQTGLEEHVFPEECLWEISEILPGEEFKEFLETKESKKAKHKPKKKPL
jgi:Domain of unknown function DUF29